jgi:hypothetical protein
LRGLPNNPLVHYGGPAALRGPKAALPPFHFSPASLPLRSLMALFLIAYLLHFSLSANWGSAPVIPDAILWSLSSLCFVVVLALLFGLCRDTLSLLCDPRRAQSLHSLDSALLHSPLSDQELLLGSLLRLLRPLLIPVLLCSLLLSFVREMLFLQSQGGSVWYSDGAQILAGIWRVLTDFLLRAPSALLALVCFSMLLISLSSEWTSAWPLYFGTGAALLWQLLLSGSCVMFLFVNDPYAVSAVFTDDLYRLPAYAGLATSLAVLTLALYLARSLRWPQPLLAGLLPLTGYGLLVLYPLSQGSAWDNLKPSLLHCLQLELYWALTAFAVLNPQRLYEQPYMDTFAYYSGLRAVLLMVLQLLLILVLAEFARDAVARRRQGSLAGEAQQP